MEPRGTKCSLCKKKIPGISLIQTECCNHWICDDEHTYQMFSFGNNSCYRNHFRYTSCAWHCFDGHTGKWQDCARCKRLKFTNTFDIPDQSTKKKTTRKSRAKPRYRRSKTTKQTIDETIVQAIMPVIPEKTTPKSIAVIESLIQATTSIMSEKSPAKQIVSSKSLTVMPIAAENSFSKSFSTKKGQSTDKPESTSTVVTRSRKNN